MKFPFERQVYCQNFVSNSMHNKVFNHLLLAFRVTCFSFSYILFVLHVSLPKLTRDTRGDLGILNRRLGRGGGGPDLKNTEYF